MADGLMKRSRIFLLFLLLAGLCSAFDIVSIRTFDSSNLSDYPEIGGIRQNIMLSYYSQGRESISPGFQAFADASLDFMQRFREARASSESGEAEALHDLTRKVGLVSASLSNMESLAKDQIPLSKFASYLARTAFERYISTEAERLKEIGDSEPRTSLKLAYYDAASSLYGYSSEKVKAAETRAEYVSIRESYFSDIMSADNLSMASWEQCSEAKRNIDSWFGLPSFVSMRQCFPGLLEARKSYVAHLEEERLREADQKLSISEETMDSVSGKVTGFFVALAVLLIVVNVLVVSRIKMWGEDSYDSSLGSEVLVWKR